uniref:tetratricopeptide repeat protein 34 n=1 Tax=Pristiophorus japonicus TaxID=55135 RepID=UPI00398F545B
MSKQELPPRLCAEGDQHLASGCPAKATACYTTAFSQSAEATVRHLQCLGERGLCDVVAVLEGWCAGQGWLPIQPTAGQAPVSAGVAAVFLSTLSPGNLAASMLRMEALLRSGRHQEVVSRCNALLNAHPAHSLALLLTRALAWVLSQRHSGNGVVDYLQAFVKRREETVAFVTTRQKEDLPQIVRAFGDYIALRDGGAQNGRRDNSLLADCRRFLAAVAPSDVSAHDSSASDCRRSPTALAPPYVSAHRACIARLFEQGRFEESAAKCSAALEEPEEKASLLIGRAAAHFAMGNRQREVIHDLASAFDSGPGLARKRFEQLFSAGVVVEQAKRFIEAQLAEYKETVRCRAELRSDGGADLLQPVLEALRLVLHVEPEAKRDLRIRLADCKLLSGDAGGSLQLCQRLLASDRSTYHNTILVLRGFCYLHAGHHTRALEDFQAILEHELPHPGSCVKAMCGRGLVRMLAGSPFLTALDYITASRLRLDEAVLVVKSYVPWNQRGLLYRVLQEEGQKILQKKNPSPSARKKRSVEHGNQGYFFKEGDALGVYYLALLLLELDPSDEVSRILSADSLYQLGRTEEAHKALLVSLSKNSQRSSVLARLALLQLKNGLLYDANQLIKKVIEIGDTSCLLPIMDIFKSEDRDLMQRHCHSKAVSILQNKEGDTYVKEAVAYLSLAIISSGGTDEASLLTRARCYAHLNQKKTAIFDFGTILKANPAHVQARCGRAFMYAVLNKQKEAVQDIAVALQTDQKLAIQEISSLKDEAQNLISSWLHDHCINTLTGMAEAKEKVFSEELVNLPAIGQSLLLINGKDSTWHILYVDILIAKEMYDDALKHLQENFGQVPNDLAATARYGLIQMKRRNALLAVQNLSVLAEKDNKDLEFLLQFLDNKPRHHMAQVASQKAGTLAKENQQKKALGYYTLAVLASKNKAKYIRSRAMCLTRLKQYERALKDLREVINRSTSSNSPELVEDYCSTGHIQLLILKDEEACKDYIKALQLDQSVALTNISSKPGRLSLSQHFQRIALRYFEQQLYEEAWNLAEYGLIIDESNTELKKLRAKIKREASGCVVH